MKRSLGRQPKPGMQFVIDDFRQRRRIDFTGNERLVRRKGGIRVEVQMVVMDLSEVQAEDDDDPDRERRPSRDTNSSASFRYCERCVE